QLAERIKAFQQVVGPNHRRQWVIDFGLKQHFVGDQPLFLRIKFHAAQTNLTGHYVGLWTIGPFDSPLAESYPQSLAADTFHEIKLDGGTRLLDPQGRLIVNFVNRNDTALVFLLEDGLEVLYREGGFGLNFIRGLGIIFCWMALFAALGLAAASFLSFPVAAFFSLGVLTLVLCSGSRAHAVSEGTSA